MPAKLAAPVKIPLIGSRELIPVNSPAAAPTSRLKTMITASQRMRVGGVTADPSFRDLRLSRMLVGHRASALVSKASAVCDGGKLWR